MDPARRPGASGPGSAWCRRRTPWTCELTVRENLLIYGRYFGLPRAEIARGPPSCWSSRSSPTVPTTTVEPLSGGMKRRLTIARSLVNDPELLLLDEPTTGLDPQARHVLWDRLFRLKQAGVTLIITTHYMDEAEQLCDRLVVMDDGRIVAEGRRRELISATPPARCWSCGSPGGRTQAAAALPRWRTWPTGIEELPDRLLLYTDDGEDALAAATSPGCGRWPAWSGASTLEDVFLRLTGRSLVD